MYQIFIDESGDHNLDQSKVDKTYPIFVLAACIFEEKYYREVFCHEFNQLKLKHFGSSDIVLHTLDMIRPLKSHDNRYKKFCSKEFRIQFYKDINTLISKTEFKIIACAILKQDHISKYGLNAIDPYILSLENIINRIVFEVEPNTANVFAEKRDTTLDHQIEIAWLNTKVSGTDKKRPTEVTKAISEFRLINKSLNEPGLQLTDLIVSPIGRRILKLPIRLAQEIDFSVIIEKFRKRYNSVMGYGLTIFPKQKGGPH